MQMKPSFISTIEEDKKTGVTVMASMEFFHQPYWTHLLIVLEAKTEGRLAKQWEKYAGPAKAVVQPSHWINKHVARKYLQRLKALYPRKKIGLIWDHSGPHILCKFTMHSD